MSKNTIIKTEEDVAGHKGIYIFGRDVTEIACFRSSFICGICTGVAGGLGCFLVTSKTLFSTHMAFASLWIGVLVYWFPCRYKFESRVSVIQSLNKQQFENRIEEDESS